MSNSVIRIRLLGGTALINAVDEAERIRKKLGCCVEFDFNGVEIFYYGQTYEEVDKYYIGKLGKPQFIAEEK